MCVTVCTTLWWLRVPVVYRMSSNPSPVCCVEQWPRVMSEPRCSSRLQILIMPAQAFTKFSRSCHTPGSWYDSTTIIVSISWQINLGNIQKYFNASHQPEVLSSFANIRSQLRSNITSAISTINIPTHLVKIEPISATQHSHTTVNIFLVKGVKNIS